MAEGVTARIKVPSSAKAGEIVSIRTRLTHKMESGFRHREDGTPIPRAIINRFVVQFNGETVLDLAVEPTVSADPYFKFETQVHESGEFRFLWYDDDGSIYEGLKFLTVS